MDDREKRRHHRLTRPFTMKFRVPGEQSWNAVTPINMSESGVCFLTTEEYPVGSHMQFYISDPLEGGKLVYECEVVRCKVSGSRSIFYETAVQIENMSDYARLVYAKMLKSFRDGSRR